MEERTLDGIEVFSNSYVSLMQKTHGKTFKIVYENITGSFFLQPVLFNRFIFMRHGAD